MITPNAGDIWQIYFKRKTAKHKYNMDNKPFTKREIRLMQMAFKSGFGWQNWYIIKNEHEREERQFQREIKKLEGQ